MFDVIPGRTRQKRTRGRTRRVASALLPRLAIILLTLAAVPSARAHCCVWKVTGNGHTLYLAGSVHALRPTDYPLPAPYDQAFAAADSVAFETDLTVPPERWSQALTKAATLPHGVLLKDRVDPRTYAYILRVIANIHGSSAPEKKIEHLKPWAISWLLETPTGGLEGLSHANGIEAHFIAAAHRAHKPMAGLVPFDQHIAVFGAMNDTDSEIVLLLEFTHLNTAGKEFEETMKAWHHGDMAALEKTVADDYRDAPSIRRRLITDRNRTWMPRLEEFLHSDKTWLVVAGSAHMSGPEGVPALLAARGYQVEQL